jgi:very-short-patch-repair endonuclease/predicted transcriptional regulator of viral defense system
LFRDTDTGIVRHVSAHAADIRVADLAARQWGVVSLHDLLNACCLTRRAVEIRVSRGHLHALHRGVYAVGHANPPLNGRFLAAVLACGPTAVLSHLSAAAIHGFFSWDDRHPEVTVRNYRHHAGIRIHRTITLDRADVVRHHALPLTSPARTLVDLAAHLNDKALRRAVRHAQSLGLTNPQELLATLERLGPRRGAARLTSLLATGPAPTRSELEDVVLDLILAGGFAPPHVNRPMKIGKQRVVPDFRWPTARLVVEADGAAWHDHRLAREDDAERQALLEAHGERVVRITWSEAITARTRTLARLRTAGAPILDPS